MSELSTATVLHWLRRVAATIRANRELLTDLDSAIGDADHGYNLDRGFAAVIESLGEHDHSDAGTVLKSAGMRLISTVGGASGPLYGTAFRRAGKVLEGLTTIDGPALREALHAFTDGIAGLGKATAGDKTMLDALLPALAALDKALDQNLPIDQALQAAAEAAHAGAEATIPLVARRGRASYLGERSAGHKDPGALSSALMVQALADVISSQA